MLPPELTEELHYLELAASRRIRNQRFGQSRSRVRGSGYEFESHRKYEIGEDLRRVDWNVSARLASPYVKTFTEERELTLMLIVDQSGSTRFGEPVSKAGLAVEVASVLALAAAYHNDRVGALLFADEVERVIPPRKGRRHALRVIRELIAFQKPEGREALGHELVDACERVAAASGGFLGIGSKVSAEEKNILKRVAATFESAHSESTRKVLGDIQS